MNVTAARGRRALAVLTTTGALLLPAAAATAAPAEQANERATEAQADNAERRDAASADEGDTSSDPDGAEWTEDNDTNDGDTPNNVVDDGDNAHPSGKDRSVEHGNGGNQGNAQSDPDDDGRGPDRSNGGPDEPNGAGGVDKADQDGNNGCGNDDDFEDDNEGWCGKPTDTAPEADEDEEVREIREDEEEEVREVRDEDEVRTPVRQDVEETTVVSASGDDCPAEMTGAGEAHDCDVADEGVLSGGFTVAIPTTTEPEVETAVLGVTFTQDVPAATTAVLGAAIQEEDEDEEGEVAADATTLPRTGAGLAGLAAFGLSALAGGTALSRRRD